MGLVLNRSHLIRSLISLEILMLSVHILFVSFSAVHGHIYGHIMSLFVLAVAGGEAAIGLAILVLFFRKTHGSRVDDMAQLRR